MEVTVDPQRLFSALSLCLDFTREGIQRHHQRVAYIGVSLADQLKLPKKERDLIFLAALVHDAGVSTWQEKSRLMDFEVENTWEHCRRGYELVSRVNILKPVAEVIISHHDKFAGPNASGVTGAGIPLAARIIHLADRVEVLLKNEPHVLLQRDHIVKEIRQQAGSTFDPLLVDSFTMLAQRESFWLGLASSMYLNRQVKVCELPVNGLHEEDVIQLANMFADVIDEKSPFTHRHSQGVAAVAGHLAGALGFSGEKLLFMEIAGLLHDLGKLSVPDEILEKPGPLNAEEYAIIRQHTFYTYHILKDAGAPYPIPQWAAYHHEKLDGSGYPFHINAEELSTGSRIMAVADVFTALREDRPYRSGMDRRSIEPVMRKMVLNNALDGEIVNALFEVYGELDRKFNHVKEK